MNASLMRAHGRVAGPIAMLILLAIVMIHNAPARETSGEADLRKIRQAGSKIEPLHQRKRPSGPHDWLAQHKEAGQTFDQYLKSNPNRPTATRTTLYVQPLGDFSETIARQVDETADFLSLSPRIPFDADYSKWRCTRRDTCLASSTARPTSAA